MCVALASPPLLPLPAPPSTPRTSPAHPHTHITKTQTHKHNITNTTSQTQPNRGGVHACHLPQASCEAAQERVRLLEKELSDLKNRPAASTAMSKEVLLGNFSHAHTCAHVHTHTHMRSRTHAHTPHKDICEHDFLANLSLACFFLFSFCAAELFTPRGVEQ